MSMDSLPAVLALGLLLPQDPVYSGPQKGEKLPGFKALGMNGPEKGREIDFVIEGKGAPILIIFVHEITRPASQLMGRLDKHAAKRGLRSVIVLLSNDMNQSERYAPILQGIMNFRSSLGISVDGKEGPGSYGLNREMTRTILLAKEDKVAANWAIRSPTDIDAPPILKAIERLTQQSPGPERPLPKGTPPSDPSLNGLLRRLIRPNNSDETKRSIG